MRVDSPRYSACTDAFSLKGNFTFPIFKGDDSEDVDEFICNFKRAGQFCGWSIDKQAQALPLYLKGIASQWFNSLLDKDTLSLDEITKKLKDEFSSEASKWRLRQNLEQRKQNPDETLSTYRTDIRNQCRRLDLPRSEWLHHFVKGLRPDIKDYVVLQQPTTIEQAENLAKLKESVSPNLSGALNTKEITDEILKQLDLKLNLSAVKTTPPVALVKIAAMAEPYDYSTVTKEKIMIVCET